MLLVHHADHFARSILSAVQGAIAVRSHAQAWRPGHRLLAYKSPTRAVQCRLFTLFRDHVSLARRSVGKRRNQPDRPAKKSLLGFTCTTLRPSPACARKRPDQIAPESVPSSEYPAPSAILPGLFARAPMPTAFLCSTLEDFHTNPL